MFQLNYELSVDAFQSNTTPTTIATISQLSGIPIGSGGSVPYFNTTVAAGQPNVPLNFVADSTLISNSLRLSKQFSDSALLSAGLSTAGLKQNSFTSVQQTAGYNDGKIGTDSAYLTGGSILQRAPVSRRFCATTKGRMTPAIRLQDFMTRSRRAVTCAW